MIRVRSAESEDRRKRVLRAGAFQVLWALMLVYIILLGIAFLFGREAGYDTSFLVCSGLAALVTVSFLAVYFVDRVSASLIDRYHGMRERRIRRTLP